MLRYKSYKYTLNKQLSIARKFILKIMFCKPELCPFKFLYEEC